jgi:hypothetical protein
MGEDDDGPQVWYAEAVGKISKNGEKFYEGYYLIPHDQNPERMVYDNNHELIPEESVMRILPVKGNYRSAWHAMGFVMNEDTFVKIGEPMSDSDSEDSDDDGIMDSDDSYSTASEDGSDVSDLIDDGETNSSLPPEKCEDVMAFDSWVPTTERERNVKKFVDELHHRAAVEMDDINF